MLSVVFFGCLTLAAPLAGEETPRRVIIGFAPQASAEERARALRSLGLRALERLEEFEALVAEVPPERAGVFSLEAALADPAVAQIEEDVYARWLDWEGPSFQGSWPWEEARSLVGAFRKAPLPSGAEEVPWGVARVNAPAAWARTQGEGVRVAVLDTGIDAGHPDLKDRVAGGVNILDSGAPFLDDNGHGTHVAGTIAADLDGRGVVGVAPGARLYAVKALNKEGGARVSSLIKALLWCARNGIQVANMSLGAPLGSLFLRLAVQHATNKGVAIVAAAGNSGRAVEYPGGYPEVIAVSASDRSDRLANFSSRGPKVEFIAPGVDVRSAFPGGGYESLDGTSMAAPHVAGLAALAVARGARGPEGVRAALKASARSLGLGRAEGFGMVDAARIAP